MIRINGRPFDTTPLQARFAEGSVEADALKKMAAGADTYSFDSEEMLLFELSLRAKIVQAAQDLYRSGMDFAIFRNSRANPAYWERTRNGGFQLKPGARPSEAIRDIFANGRQYATECATAMMMVYYKALLDMAGPEKFDALFPRITLMNWHDLDPLLRSAGVPKTVRDHLPGDRAYFKNPDVDPETPQWQGENVIVLPNGLFYGHGLGIHNAETIIRALNGNRRPGAQTEAFFMDSAGRLDTPRLFSALREAPARPVSLQWRLPEGVRVR